MISLAIHTFLQTWSFPLESWNRQGLRSLQDQSSTRSLRKSSTRIKERHNVSEYKHSILYIVVTTTRTYTRCRGSRVWRCSCRVSIGIDAAAVRNSVVIDNAAHIMMRLTICCKLGEFGTSKRTACGEENEENKSE